jgi:Defence against restriction A N-terminal
MKSLLFDLDKLVSGGDKAGAKAVQMFIRAGIEVLSAYADPKLKRKSSISYRDVTFNFKDNQSAVFSVKQTGDIFQVALNGKLIPLKEQDDATKSIAEIVSKLTAGRAKFQASLAKARMPVPQGMKSSKTKVIEALQAQGKELDASIAETKAKLEKFGKSGVAQAT